ncbi:MAG: right-handed parallel beta-helix repeat-containing protein [Pseudomonadota bacterium]
MKTGLNRLAVSFAAAAIGIAGFISLAGLGSLAQAASHDGASLQREIEKAKKGAVIDVPAGTYDLKDVKLYRDVTLRGDPEGGTIFHSAEVTDKGVLIPLTGVSLTVENVHFKDVNSWDRNGAGIRHEGKDLTVINCLFDNNEDGILATGDTDGRITITDTTFKDSGFGDGQSHGIYVLNAAHVEITDSTFVGTRIGHHIKSLADTTIIRDSTLDDAAGRSSYAVDSSKGGNVTITGNTIIQSADADNYHIFNYDLTRGGDVGEVVITDNKIINRFDGGRFLRNDTRAKPVISGNEIVNEGKRPLKM